MLPVLGLPALPAVAPGAPMGADAGATASRKPGQAELWSWGHTQAFPMGDKPGEAAQSNSHRGGLVLSKQGLANKS